jgi:hypothetical protein
LHRNDKFQMTADKGGQIPAVSVQKFAGSVIGRSESKKRDGPCFMPSLLLLRGDFVAILS